MNRSLVLVVLGLVAVSASETEDGSLNQLESLVEQAVEQTELYHKQISDVSKSLLSNIELVSGGVNAKSAAQVRTIIQETDKNSGLKSYNTLNKAVQLLENLGEDELKPIQNPLKEAKSDLEKTSKSWNSGLNQVSELAIKYEDNADRIIEKINGLSDLVKKTVFVQKTKKAAEALTEFTD